MWYRINDDIPEVNPFLQGVLFFFNVLYWLFSCAVLGIGLYAYLEKDADLTTLTDLITDPAIGLMVVGTGVFCLTFFGCVGALRQNVCMLKFFSSVLMISLVVQLILGLVLFIISGQALKLVDDYFKVLIGAYREDLDTTDIIDWGQEYSVLDTFCGFGVLKQQELEAKETIYTTGCIHAITEWIHQHLFLLAALGIAMVVPQIVGICISRILLLQIKDQQFYADIREKVESLQLMQVHG
ncbi:tetraspanin-33-like isoform X2 [Ciona intestinalis]